MRRDSQSLSSCDTQSLNIVNVVAVEPDVATGRVAKVVRRLDLDADETAENGGEYPKMTLRSKLRRIKDRVFPERQILVRSDGNVRFVTLNGSVQIAASAGLMVLLGVVANAGYNYSQHDELIDARDARIAKMAEEYDALSDNLDAIHSRYESITNDLSEKQRYLQDLLKQRTTLSQQLHNLNKELKLTSSQRDQAKITNEMLHRKAGALGDQLDNALTTTQRLEMNLRHMGVELSETMSARDHAQAQRTQLSESVQRLQFELAQTRANKVTLANALRLSVKRLDDVTVERDAVHDRNTELILAAERLQRRMAMLEDSQSQLVSRIHARTDSNIDDLESAVNLTGIDVNLLLDRMHKKNATASGGPLVEFAPQDFNRELSEELVGLESRLSRWSALNGVLEILPVVPPVEQYSISSRYGYRRDPFTKKRAYHSGMDFAAATKSTIYSTAAGLVTFVGWDGAYGRTVEIDHGLGIKTRYGHLRKILVKKGQKVAFRQKIGLMGSSGRSTGSHVHYEIKFDKKHVNPAAFLKAGKYVFKLQNTASR
jgi:murein DD-endopeptidase MepM/ murein hydrolase activator NlpD